MDKLPASGLGALARMELELQRIFELVPTEHRGLRFERVMQNFHPQQNTCMLELGFAIEWALRNTGIQHQLYTNLATDSDDPRANAAPKTGRDWEVAELVAATTIRWLATASGCSFLQEAFKRGGGSMNYELPDPVKGMPPLPTPSQRFESDDH